MNRIYQGRVSKVEILNGKNADGQPLGYRLFRIGHSAKPPHHETFQVAAN